MAGITLEQAQKKLDLWLEAEETVASGQEYTVNTGGSTRTMRRADLAEIAKRITYWETKVQNLSGDRRVRSLGANW